MRNCVVSCVAVLASACASEPKHEEVIGLGRFQDQEICATSVVATNQRLAEAVDTIGQRVARFGERPDLTWTFRVIHDPEVKAYATSGGYVYVHTGLLDVIGTADELAAVISHEVSHIREDHLTRRLHNAEAGKAKGKFAEWGVIVGVSMLQAMASAYGSQPGMYTPPPTIDHQALAQAAAQVGYGVQVSAIEGFHRDTEVEADRRAVGYLSQAGFDSYALVRVLKTLESVRDRLNTTGHLYQTALINKEPGLEERVRLLEEYLQSLGGQGAAR